MRVLFASSEMSPFARTGGLGDVVGALPAALSALGAEVSVVLPLYRSIDRQKFVLAPFGGTRRAPVAGRSMSFSLQKASLGPVSVYFVDRPEYFHRENYYGTTDSDYPDNAERFIFFSRAVLALASLLEPRPQVIHCHDWQSALVPVYSAMDREYKVRFKDSATVLTLHNLGYQGIFPRVEMQTAGLGPSLFTPAGLEFWGQMNFLKGGIVFADALTTVSRKYAEEIQTPELGFGLDGVIRVCREKLTGILNGVDYARWDPLSDPFLLSTYGPGNLAGKAACKRALQRELKLEVDPKIPLVGMVSRLVEQKGIDLVTQHLSRLMSLKMQLAVLGLGAERYHERLRAFAAKHPGRFACHIGYQERLSHLIEAGSDFFLMPSRYEPCGLNQIYSLRYGTLPIVRATGGLEDTVIDLRDNPRRGNGFKFSAYTAEALRETVKLALSTYRKGGKTWDRLIANAFKADFGWETSARGYLEVYREAYRRKTGKELSA
ncbi:MAG: starch synthase [Candidatus Glassbacteria bacterium RIFCSPLOWO2_12_FULL_58_11]|uniref:Glycogen synthase n=1 Tax=Candidatus Glassbacteria bacterium RIFCSPLOWO2_12_FULL_58_11 TaxID=1817867 RepID=A0A1F5YJS4_9BACT|nr:MAG: starch synthase [Candidatus Glassbacteria bacterium RIFCSPLOWO2_12_FULL_58_11]